MGWGGAHRITCIRARGSSGVWAECRRCCDLDNQEHCLPADCNILLQSPSWLGIHPVKQENRAPPIPHSSKSYSWSPQSTALRIPRLAVFAGGCSDPEKNAGGPGTPYPCPWASRRVLLCGRATTSGMLGTGIRPSLRSPAHPLLCCSSLEFASSCAQMFHARECELPSPL